MSEDSLDLGIPSREALKIQLARDVFLQLAGMEALSGINAMDLQRLANEVIHARDSGVVDRLNNSLDLANLAASGKDVTLADVEERIPHAAVMITFQTAMALSRVWPLIQQAAGSVE